MIYFLYLKYNIENYEIVTKQLNIENIGVIKELKQNGFDIILLKDIDIKYFNKLYGDYNKKSINLKQFKDFINDIDLYNNFKIYNNLLLESEKYIIYFENDSENFNKLNEIINLDFSDFDVKKDYLKFIDKNYINNINLIIGNNISKIFIEYYHFLNKKLSTKIKDNRLKKEVLEFIFGKTEEELELIINVLRKVIIRNFNKNDLKINIDLIVKYKYLLEENFSIITNNLSLQDLASILNDNGKKIFFVQEFGNKGLEEYIIDDLLEKYKDDISLKLLLNISNYIDLEDFLIIFEDNLKINNLKILLNFFILLNQFGLESHNLEDYFNQHNNIFFNILERNINFIRKNSLYFNKKENKNNIIDLIKGIKNIDDFQIILHFDIPTKNELDKNIFEIIEKKDNKKASEIVNYIDNFFYNFFQDFHPKNTSSTSNKNFGKGSGSYTRTINKILKSLKKNSNENNLNYLNRIKILNFNNFYLQDVDITDKRILNILNNSKNIDLPFLEALQNFSDNVIKKIELNNNENLSQLIIFYDNLIIKD